LWARLFCGLFLPGPRSFSELHEQAFFIVRGKGPGNRASPESLARHLDHFQIAAWLPASQPQTRQTAAAQRSAWQAWHEYLRELLQIRDGLSSEIFCLQTHGSLFNFHPHVHALVLPELVREGRFHELNGCSAIAVSVRFRARFLTALKNQEVLDSDEI